jgi:hypothetical protein
VAIIHEAHRVATALRTINHCAIFTGKKTFTALKIFCEDATFRFNRLTNSTPTGTEWIVDKYTAV